VIVVVVIFGQRLVVLLVVVAVINVAAAEGVYVADGAIAHSYCYNYTMMILELIINICFKANLLYPLSKLKRLHFSFNWTLFLSNPSFFPWSLNCICK
jgi:hypothetical protein